MIKSLLTILVTSSALLLTATSSSAQVNIKALSEVAKSCQEDASVSKYYAQMNIDIHGYDASGPLQECIRHRYHYSQVLSKLHWLNSSGEMLPGYPGSVAVAALSLPTPLDVNIVDCIATQDASSKECQDNIARFRIIARGFEYRKNNSLASTDFDNYIIFVCPSCVVAHDDVVDKQKMIAAFINWFLSLEKPRRKELISTILGNETLAYETRYNMDKEAWAAISKYEETSKMVEQQSLEQRRQELLGK